MSLKTCITLSVKAVTYDGTPLLLHPPLYPALLATIDYLFGIDPLSQAPIVIYTNDPDAIYILANLTAKMSPLRTMYNSQAIVNNLSDLKRFLARRGQRVVSCLV